MCEIAHTGERSVVGSKHSIIMRTVLAPDTARRRVLATVLAVAVPTLPTLPSSALIGEVITAGFTQGDDKSWDLTLPSSWKLSDVPARQEYPKHLFHVRATRTGVPGASLEVVVDRLKENGATLTAYGKLDAVAEKLRALQPQPATTISAALVKGAIKGSNYYQFAYGVAGGATTRAKLSVQQSRSYMLTVTLPDQATSEVQVEADAIIQSFKAFPINIICLSQSNSGTEPVAGSCY